MNMIYETKGRAREFNELALNHYSGCGHACVYCYGADVTHQDVAKFRNDPQVRISLYELGKQAAALQKAGEKRPVLLSFVTDPYQPLDAEVKLTRSIIQLLHDHSLGVVILTKGGRRAMRDFDMLIPGKDQFATTLTCLDIQQSVKWEPGAALPAERILSLREANLRGIETWVSLEPVIDPKTVYRIIDLTDSFVGHYKVGTMNYHPHGRSINWGEFGKHVLTELRVRHCRYYVKKDLAKYLGMENGFWSDDEEVIKRWPHLFR